MSEYLSAFSSKTAEAAFLSKYDECMKLWPVPYEEDYVETDIGQTCVIQCGSKKGPVLVLLHGKGGTSAMWSQNIAELAREYCIIAVDIPSDLNKTRFKKPFDSTEEAADWLNRVMDKMGIGKYSVMGVSYGSFFAMNMAVQAPERVESLIIVSPTESFAKIRLPFWYWIIKSAVSPFDSTKMKFLEYTNAGKPLQIPQCIADLLIMGMKCANLRIKPLVHRFSDEELSHIKSPVLLLIGNKEVVTKVDEVVARASRLIKNIRCQLIDDAGHTLATARPDVVNSKVMDFLNGVHAGSKS